MKHGLYAIGFAAAVLAATTARAQEEALPPTTPVATEESDADKTNGATARPTTDAIVLSGQPQMPGKQPSSASSGQDEELVARSAAMSDEQKKQVLALFATGFQLWKAGDFKAAAIAFAQGLDTDPANGPANYYYGDSLRRNGDIPAATDYLTRAAAFAAGAPEQYKAQAELQTLKNPTQPVPQSGEPLASLSGDFATNPLDGSWQINASKIAPFGFDRSWLTKVTISGNDSRMSGTCLDGPFIKVHVDGERVRFDCMGGIVDHVFEGSLTSPTRMEGHWHNFLFTGSWSAEKL